MNALARHCVIPLALIAFAGAAAAQGDPHRIVQPDQLKWADVPSLPAGAKIAVIEGPMNEAKPFTIRLRFPANYRIPPHIHPAVERVTVLSGTFHLAMGEKFDPAAGQAMPPGATAIMPPGMTHYAWTTAETVVQLHGTGPWGITYVRDADDPRKE
jgi:hypothetical protein